MNFLRKTAMAVVAFSTMVMGWTSRCMPCCPRARWVPPCFINIRLEDKDNEKPLGKKERDALMFRLGVLTVERVNAQRAYEDARYRARDL